MASAMTAASVEAAATANRATAAYCATATNCAAVKSTADRYMRTAVEAASDCTTSDRAAMPAITAVPAITTVPAVAAAVTWASVVTAMEPRARADEDATGEVARAVVAVRRTGVWVVSIVAIAAYWSRPNIPRSDSHAHYNALGASVRRERQGSSKYRENHQIFHEVFHIWAPSEPVKPLNL